MNCARCGDEEHLTWMRGRWVCVACWLEWTKSIEGDAQRVGTVRISAWHRIAERRERRPDRPWT